MQLLLHSLFFDSIKPIEFYDFLSTIRLKSYKIISKTDINVNEIKILIFFPLIYRFK